MDKILSFERARRQRDGVDIKHHLRSARQRYRDLDQQGTLETADDRKMAFYMHALEGLNQIKDGDSDREAAIAFQTLCLFMKHKHPDYLPPAFLENARQKRQQTPDPVSILHDASVVTGHAVNDCEPVSDHPPSIPLARVREKMKRRNMTGHARDVLAELRERLKKATTVPDPATVLINPVVLKRLRQRAMLLKIQGV